MSDHAAAPSVVQTRARRPISWSTATLVTPLMPALLSSTPKGRGWGLGLLAGVAACLPWALYLYGGRW